MRYSLMLMIVICTQVTPSFDIARGVHAQDELTKDAPFTFHLRDVPDAYDPDPTKQTPDERLKTIRKRISGAIQLLEKKSYKSFFNDYIDPFWLARIGGISKISVDEVFAKFMNSPKRVEYIDRQFIEVLKQSLKDEPQWLLNGRAASFMEGNNSHATEFWIYFEGKWRISPET